MSTSTRCCKPLTKATYRIERYEDAIPTIYQAYRMATEGEPGPVFVELPANLQLLTGEVDEMPAFAARAEPPFADGEALRQGGRAAVGRQAPRHLRRLGRSPRLAEDIARIAEHLAAPVATTLQGLAAFPAEHRAACRHGLWSLRRSGRRECLQGLRCDACSRDAFCGNLHGQLRLRTA